MPGTSPLLSGLVLETGRKALARAGYRRIARIRTRLRLRSAFPAVASGSPFVTPDLFRPSTQLAVPEGDRPLVDAMRDFDVG